MKMGLRFIDINMILDHPEYPSESTFESIERRMGLDEVGGAVVSSMRALADFSFSPSNDRVQKSIAGKGNFVGLGTILPHHGPEEVKRCMKDLGFKGIRLFPDIHWTILNLRRPLMDPIIETVRELKGILYLNSGRSDPWSNPGTVLDVAKRFPEIPTILGHMWDSYLWPDAIVVARRCPNVFLEIPVVATGVIQQAIREIGTDRLLAGSGYPASSPGALQAIIHHLDLAENEKNAILYKNAQTLFGF
jgi:predicted TIM-barrel fold metal-dependent hydrolase